MAGSLTDKNMLKKTLYFPLRPAGTYSFTDLYNVLCTVLFPRLALRLGKQCARRKPEKDQRHNERICAWISEHGHIETLKSATCVVCVDANGDATIFKYAGLHKKARVPASVACASSVVMSLCKKIFERELVIVPIAISESKVAKHE